MIAKQLMIQRKREEYVRTKVWPDVTTGIPPSQYLERLEKSLPPPEPSLPAMPSFISVPGGSMVRLTPFSEPWLEKRQMDEGESVFSRLFCRTCFCFLCLVYPPSFVVVPPLKPESLDCASASRALPCSSGCFCCRAVASSSDVCWTDDEKAMFLRAIDLLSRARVSVSDRSFCAIAKMIGTRTCAEVRDFFTEYKALVDESDPEDDCACSSTTVEKRPTNTKFFVPCCHTGPCIECHRYCQRCVDAAKKEGGTIDVAALMTLCKCTDVTVTKCDKECLCDCDGASQRWSGCECAKGECGEMCACRNYNRECDPDLCKSCSSCFAHRTATSGAKHCGNMAVQSGDFKRVSVAPSTIPGAGWGLFAVDEIEKGSVIGVYAGEVVKNDETGRVEEGQYSSELTDFLEVSGIFIANKTRFMNDPDGPAGGSRKKNIQPYVMSIRGRVCFVIGASCTVKPGKELFFSYGKEYWKRLTAGEEESSRDEDGMEGNSGEQSDDDDSDYEPQ